MFLAARGNLVRRIRATACMGSRKPDLVMVSFLCLNTRWHVNRVVVRLRV